MEQLKPCPFCGGEAQMKMREAQIGSTRCWYAYCPKCHARTEGYVEPDNIAWSPNPFAVIEETIADAAALWNARAQEQAPNTAPTCGPDYCELEADDE